MTGTKRLSLHGRLRMAAACPDPNAALLAEAADAIEQHEAFRQEVSDAIEALKKDVGTGWDHCRPAYACNRFIIAKPDPLAEAMTEVFSDNGEWEPCDEADANALRAAIAKRGGKIVWENEQ